MNKEKIREALLDAMCRTSWDPATTLYKDALAELYYLEKEDLYGLRVGDIVEVLNQDGEVRENWGFCGRGDRGRVLRLFAPYVTININGKEGTTRICNVMKISQ